MEGSMRYFFSLLAIAVLAISCSNNQNIKEGKSMAKAEGAKPLSYLSELGEMIPREVLFGNPDKTGVKISPDGLKMSWLESDESGILNVFIKNYPEGELKQVTKDEKRGIRSYGWTYDSEKILYIQDKDGDENWHLYIVDLKTGETKDMTPFPGVRAQNLILDRKFPDKALIGLNKRDAAVFDMYRLDLKTGELEMTAENPGDVAGWGTDHEFKLRIAVATDPVTADEIVRIRNNETEPFRELIRIPFGENGGVINFAPDNKNLYFLTSTGSDTVRLVLLDGENGAELKTIFVNEKADISDVMTDPDTHEILAVSVEYTKLEYFVMDESVKADFEYLSELKDGQFYIVSQDLSKTKLIVAYMLDNAPYSYYFYDRSSKKADFLFTHNQDLEKYKLAKMDPVIIKSRDGLDLVSYLTLPLNVKPENLPLVLDVHGGPWARDSWGYNSVHQWLANRGYAVLSVNFRSSTGFGKKFLNAGDNQWGKNMQNDLTDAVKWAIEKGIADKSKVVIMGGSYGGYATLAGLTFTPELYAAGVDIVGPSNLKTLLETIPPYWATFKKQMVLRIGDVENNEELNKEISPLFHASKIKAPLMIGQGANDPRVKIAESDQIVAEMRKNDLPVTYIVYPDEGHGFARPENRMDFFGRVEGFLSFHIGGRAEKFEKDDKSSALEK